MPANAAPAEVPNPFLDMMTALSNHHGQIDLHLDHVSLKLPFTGQTVELNGSVSVSVHLRELSDRERTAHAAREVRRLGQ
ncbi:MAG TPA: hypothetical protein VMG36_04195 [Thermoplasmata archaeon]|nr:hypothetical protein [Thermoplasmata archaeon]